MRMTGMLLALALPGLGGCTAPETAASEFHNLDAALRYDLAAYAGGIPFQHGEVSVIATENGKLRTYRLTPCQGGETVCAGGPNGRAGKLTRVRNYHVVSGAYRGRAFYLGINGTGFLGVNGQFLPLAWE